MPFIPHIVFKCRKCIFLTWLTMLKFFDTTDIIVVHLNQ